MVQSALNLSCSKPEYDWAIDKNLLRYLGVTSGDLEEFFGKGITGGLVWTYGHLRKGNLHEKRLRGKALLGASIAGELPGCWRRGEVHENVYESPFFFLLFWAGPEFRGDCPLEGDFSASFGEFIPKSDLGSTGGVTVTTQLLRLFST